MRIPIYSKHNALINDHEEVQQRPDLAKVILA